MRLPISALLMICFAGICFFLFITFNFAFHGDGGIKEVIWDAANNTLTGDRATMFDENMGTLSQGFGLAGVVCIGLAVVFFIADALGSPPDRGF